VRRHLPLARSLAGRYRNSLEPFDDLVQVANMGLVHAVNRFDADRGIPFVAFATPTIVGELKRHFRNTGWSVHVPRGAQELAVRLQIEVAHLTERLGRSPQVDELAEATGLSEEEVLLGLEAAQAHHAESLDVPAGDSEADAASLGELLGSVDDRYDLVETATVLQNAIRGLPHQERLALVLRIDHDLKQSEIARRMGCSQMQVSRLLRRASERLNQELQLD
jgi:RNA polymerase sigma-B factor